MPSFHIEHLGADLGDYLREDEAYARSLRIVVEALQQADVARPWLSASTVGAFCQRLAASRAALAVRVASAPAFTAALRLAGCICRR
jgi:hypothetical protein